MKWVAGGDAFARAGGCVLIAKGLLLPSAVLLRLQHAAKCPACSLAGSGHLFAHPVTVQRTVQQTIYGSEAQAFLGNLAQQNSLARFRACTTFAMTWPTGYVFRPVRSGFWTRSRGKAHDREVAAVQFVAESSGLIHPAHAKEVRCPAAAISCSRSS